MVKDRNGRLPHSRHLSIHRLRRMHRRAKRAGDTALRVYIALLIEARR